MINPREYGSPPFIVVVIHGGPGAAGQMRPVAQELSQFYGTLEPLQTSMSLEGQINELHSLLKKHETKPMTLIGHSWGAWLVFLYASQYSSSVKKIILVSSSPFEEHYAAQIMTTRLNRLNEKEKIQFYILIDGLNNQYKQDKTKFFTDLGKLLFKTDSFNLLQYTEEEIEYRYDIFECVWNEAEKLRRNGTLLEMGKQIRCPVVAIHGDYDPHPSTGIEEPLSRIVKDFRFILLKKCGHYPWMERDAKNNFYKIIYEELQ